MLDSVLNLASFSTKAQITLEHTKAACVVSDSPEAVLAARFLHLSQAPLALVGQQAEFLDGLAHLRQSLLLIA